jgi:hypothetical protein
LQFLQSRPHPATISPISTAQQAWNQVVERLNTATPEQRQHQRQAVTELLQSWDHEVADREEPEESWEVLKIALDQNCPMTFSSPAEMLRERLQTSAPPQQFQIQNPSPALRLTDYERGCQPTRE